MPSAPSFFHHKHRGSALLLLLIIVVVGAAFLLNALKSNPHIERDKVTADALAKAKEALIGYAATYRDNAPGHANDVFGYFPCPDTNNDGVAEPSCGGTDISEIGRLPWQTLGLPPLRDSSGECLWYAVSGRYKNNSPTAALNWDTTGQFIIQDAGGSTLAGTSAETRAVAVVFSPRGVLAGQARTSGANECSGDNTNNAAAYLDGGDPLYAGTPPAAGANSTLTVSTAASIANGVNNDRALWITPNEAWERIRRRGDFVTDITNLLADIRDQAAMDAACATTTAFDPPLPGSIVEAGVSGKNVGMAPAIAQICIPADALKRMAVFNSWRNNALYATCPSAATPCLTVNGASCAGAVIFSGERVAGRARPSTAAADYLEGNNLSAFTSATTVLSGAGPYAWNASSQDIALCIPPTGGGGATQISFTNPTDFAKFDDAIFGAGVTVDPDAQTLAIEVAAGSSGGCAWFPDPITLNGKTLRAYHTFQFAHADPIGAVDLGYGFTLSFIRASDGPPTTYTCNSQSNMGVVPTTDRLYSMFVETDIHQAGSDPAGNHTAIMLNGNLSHSGAFACDGSAQGCLHSPANKFEESPTPTEHNQRIEIHTGYNSNCTATGGTFALVKVWVDCSACNDTSANFSTTPTAKRCFDLDSTMNTVYFGFTGGFSSSGGNVQGVTVRNLDLRVE